MVNKIVEYRINQCKNVLLKKGAEYGKQKNRLYSFHEGSKLLKTSSSKYLISLWMKHFVSVKDMIFGDGPINNEYVNEKFGDAINYMFLLEGVALASNLNQGACLSSEEFDVIFGDTAKRIVDFFRSIASDLANEINDTYVNDQLTQQLYDDLIDRAHEVVDMSILLEDFKQVRSVIGDMINILIKAEIYVRVKFGLLF